MSDKPSYDELAQRVKELEREIVRLRREKTSPQQSSVELRSTHPPGTDSDTPLTDYDLATLINAEELQSIMDDFFSLTGMVTAILDLDGNIIESTGWQKICTQFHRVHPETAQYCTESDLFLAKNLKPQEVLAYKCKNGLSDVVTPLYIDNKHLGNIYTGQFFYDDEEINKERFLRQAEKYGFEKDDYLEAFRQIPIYSRETIDTLMRFLVKFTSYISRISLFNTQLKREIRERHKAENALQESAALLRTLIRAIPDLVWLKDQQGTYLFCNSRFEDFFGATESEIVGKTDYDFVDTDLADFFRKHDKQAMEQKRPTKNEEEIVFASDNHRELLETIKTPLYSSDGEIAGVLGIGRDITERKRAEEEKETLSTLLQQSQKMEAIGILAGGVAHDFNNMLGVIIGHSEMAMDQVDPSLPLFADLDQIRQAAEHSADITRQLLAFARKQTIAPKVLDLNDTVEGMLKMLERLIGEDINLVWSPAPDLWHVRIDPSQVDQILANLCVNARTAIAGVGKITVTTENTAVDDHYIVTHMDSTPGDYVTISVSDTGCGIAASKVPHIFEPFFTTNNVGNGTGLGLATVFGAVKQNNGFINVYSEPGNGSTFKIYLPRYRGEKEQKERIPATEEMLQGHETILLVEDDPILLNMTTRMLLRLGYTPLAAGSPRDAIAQLTDYDGKIDMVITDVIMPEMNGRDLADHLLTIQPDLKCLFMSGYTANVISHRGVLDAGVNFMQKPFTSKELASRVRQVLDKDDPTS